MAQKLVSPVEDARESTGRAGLGVWRSSLLVCS